MSPSIDAVILDTNHSKYTHLMPVDLKTINLDQGFWRDRVSQNLNVTIPNQLRLLETTGRLDNFRRVSGEVRKPFQGYVFNDSDVYKWLEAAAWSLASQPDEQLKKQVDLVISLISNAQDKDGYLNTFFSLDKLRERWMNLQEKHELYCAGHLIQAAIAHHRATGEEKLMSVAIRFADHICTTFGPSQVVGTSGHPEIEMALVELYRETGDQKYLQQADIFIDRRGKGLLGRGEYLLDHIPFRQMDHLVGHAVRALYLCCGATDLVLETGEKQLVQTLEHLWQTMVTQQMYLTGGVGARHEGEALGEPYELPNTRAYAETCAAIANVMWNWRMLQLGGKARYTDLMEWTLYNAVLPGISLDGNSYFYVNPLENDGSHRRQEWFDCACCPPNVARTIAAMTGYMYSLSSEGIWLHLYAASTAGINLQNGRRVTIQQITSYPWDQNVRIKISDISISSSSASTPEKQARFSIFLRIPGWLEGNLIEVKLNGKLTHYHSTPGSYLEIQRQWKPGDTIDLCFPMVARLITSHPAVKENAGRVAITLGPLVYCAEAVDNPGIDISDTILDSTSPIESEFMPGLLGGITRLNVRGSPRQSDSEWNDNLYRPLHSSRAHRQLSHQVISFIPYFAWANRQPGAMSVWHKYK